MKNLIFITLFLITSLGFSQDSLADLLKQHNTHSVPYISVQELAMPKTNAIILDAREHEEYKVSHLKNAIFVGYNNFDLDQTTFQLTNNQQTIVVYCSLGIRSENIADKLKKAGFINVYNLYGGIFEWKNEDLPVFDSEGKETENIHAFSKEWSRWLLKGNIVY